MVSDTYTNQLINVICGLLGCKGVLHFEIFLLNFCQPCPFISPIHSTCGELKDLFQLTSHWLLFHHKANKTVCRHKRFYWSSLPEPEYNFERTWSCMKLYWQKDNRRAETILVLFRWVKRSLSIKQKISRDKSQPSCGWMEPRCISPTLWACLNTFVVETVTENLHCPPRPHHNPPIPKTQS